MSSKAPDFFFSPGHQTILSASCLTLKFLVVIVVQQLAHTGAVEANGAD